MYKLRLCTYILLSFIAFGLQSCGDDNENEPTVNDIQGTWLLIHYSYKYHYQQNDTWWEDTKEEDIVSSYWWYDPMGIEPTKYMEHLTFNTKDVFVWLAEYPLPTTPDLLNTIPPLLLVKLNTHKPLKIGMKLSVV